MPQFRVGLTRVKPDQQKELMVVENGVVTLDADHDVDARAAAAKAAEADSGDIEWTPQPNAAVRSGNGVALVSSLQALGPKSAGVTTSMRPSAIARGSDAALPPPKREGGAKPLEDEAGDGTAKEKDDEHEGEQSGGGQDGQSVEDGQGKTPGPVSYTGAATATPIPPIGSSVPEGGPASKSDGTALLSDAAATGSGPEGKAADKPSDKQEPPGPAPTDTGSAATADTAATGPGGPEPAATDTVKAGTGNVSVGEQKAKPVRQMNLGGK